uniref:Aldehyde dehydrogenase domain-containing protein n=1 Tax=Psilocybe cubensis TaxID=181762 RepID=A0A8H7Y178_PSICU
MIKPYDLNHAADEIPVINPATGEGLANVVSSSSKLVEDTINTAQKAYTSGVWSKASPLSRSKVLSKLARLLEAKIPELALLETAQTGRTIREMNAQLGRLPEWLDYFAAVLRTHQAFVAPTQGKLLNYVERVPLGVVAQITPFNHPLLIAIKKIAPALAAGNSVIVKPSELAPLTVYKFVEMAQEAGVPPGVLSVLPGGHQTGQDIVRNPLIRKVDITAGTSTGRQLGSIVGANLSRYTAELGGKAPIIVFEDADLVSAVNGVAFASFVASGQTCVSGTRILLHSTIYEEFMDKFLTKVNFIRNGMGNPSNPASTMGTVISTKHLERIDAMVKRAPANAKILTGGEPLGNHASTLDGFDFSKGSFYPPTVITGVSIEDELWQEEVFGPVVVVKTFENEADGIALANASKYGLGAGIWTLDISRAHRVAAAIESGLCWVNTHHRNDPSSPWYAFH